MRLLQNKTAQLLSLIEKASRMQRALACLGLGLIGAAGMAPTYAWPVLLLSLSFLYLLIERTGSAKGAIVYGFLFGFGYFFAGFFWIKNALLVEGNPFSWIWPLAVAGLPSVMALFTACGAYAAKRLVNLKTVSGFLAFTALIAASEWARGFVFTGFPWNLFGYTWGGTLPMIQNVAIGNIYFLTWLTLIWFCLPGFLLLFQPSAREKKSLGVFALASFALCLAFGFWRLETAAVEIVPDVNIRLIQPNIAQAEKWDRSKSADHFVKAINLSKADESSAKKTIIIWPETAINSWIMQDPMAMTLIKSMLESYEGDAALLSGILRFDPQTDSFYNSLVMFDKNGNMMNIYNKHHLVPFGEYIPYQKWIPLKPVVEFTGFVLGDGLKTFDALGIKYSPIICYEIIFSGKVAGRESPDLIVNVTNDAWYGVSAGPYQHLDQAVFRAVEEGIPVVRSANTGFSGVIDPLGIIHARSDLYQEYEKTLALPAKFRMIRNNILLKNVIFMALILSVTMFGSIKNKKIR